MLLHVLGLEVGSWLDGSLWRNVGDGVNSFV